MSKRFSKDWSLFLALALGGMTTAMGSAGAASLYRIADGKNLYWQNPGRPEFALYPQNISPRLTSGAVKNVMAKALQEYFQISLGVIDAHFYVPSETGKKTSASDDTSKVFFASQSDLMGEDSNVIAWTQVWYDPNNGRIRETDLWLNDVGYRFDEVKLKGVIVHELGHAFGLSHSSVESATMYPYSTANQEKTTCDDQMGLKQAYPSIPTQSTHLPLELKSISGEAFERGTLVRAFEIGTGLEVATSLTDAEGKVQFDLPHGRRYLFEVGRLTIARATLSPYYAKPRVGNASTTSYCRTSGPVTADGSTPFEFDLTHQAPVGTQRLSLIQSCGISESSRVSNAGEKCPPERRVQSVYASRERAGPENESTMGCGSVQSVAGGPSGPSQNNVAGLFNLAFLAAFIALGKRIISRRFRSAAL